MKTVKENPPLNYNTIRNYEPIGLSLIVSSPAFPIAKELAGALLMQFREQNPNMEEKELLEKFGFNISVQPNLKEKEWIAIQRSPQEVFYSKGDGTN